MLSKIRDILKFLMGKIMRESEMFNKIQEL